MPILQSQNALAAVWRVARAILAVGLPVPKTSRSSLASHAPAIQGPSGRIFKACSSVSLEQLYHLRNLFSMLG
jgi:hypothetical protein